MIKENYKYLFRIIILPVRGIFMRMILFYQKYLSKKKKHKNEKENSL